jgi:cell division septation protein DedD
MSMNRKTVSSTVLFLAFLAVAAFEPAKMAAANPTSLIPLLPQAPDNSAPLIYMLSPKANATVNASTVKSVFVVGPPSTYMAYSSSVISVYYTLDGVINDVTGQGTAPYRLSGSYWVQYEMPRFESGDWATNLVYEVDLTGLSEGRHTLRVSATSIGYYLPNASKTIQPDNFTVTAYSEPVPFTVNTATPSPSPPPTPSPLPLSMPSPSPTSTPTPQPTLTPSPSPSPSPTPSVSPSSTHAPQTAGVGADLPTATGYVIAVSLVSVAFACTGAVIYMWKRKQLS